MISDGTSSVKEVGEASKVVEEVSDVEKADEAVNTAEKAEGAMNAVENAEGLMQKSGDLTEAGSFDKTAGIEGKYSGEGKGLDEKFDVKDVDLSKSAIIKTLKSNFNAIFDIVY
ncbi:MULTISPECIES: hypothetical protein [Clostridium]|uniref:hypothetical protein n=1 Tax=Clostridium TaxID=1485 RepID=UPI00069CC079|nr:MULTISPECIES: hypothetical protein [Clostridium]KOF57163.1 hypothetical protein AGR56_11795 [Clostridium sp. DMHC 10]